MVGLLGCKVGPLGLAELDEVLGNLLGRVRVKQEVPVAPGQWALLGLKRAT